MFYFVPAWYDNQWGILNNQIEFDDAINHIRMFKKAGEPLCILVNNYFPQLRHFLHRQELLGTPVWSVFDAIQGFQDEHIHKVLQIDDFEWDTQTEFIYTPFLILVRHNKQHIANIILNDFGKIASIEYCHNQYETHIFDDRGFLSSIIYFDEHKVAQYQDYMNLLGQWCIRVHLLPHKKHVDVNLDSGTPLSKCKYDSLDDVISDMINQKGQTFHVMKDYLILSAHQQHNDMYLTRFPYIKKGLSFFLNRCEIDSLKVNNRWLKTSFIITDTKEKQLQCQQLFPQISHCVYHLPPYDTRLRLGTSQRTTQLKIAVIVDNLDTNTLDTLFYTIAKMMSENKHIALVMMTREKYKAAHYKQQVMQILDNFSVVVEQEDNNLSMQQLEDTTWYSKRIDIIAIQTEQDVILSFETVRVIVDLQDQPDVFIQIAAISAGIPQINIVSSQYVSHQKNGYIMTRLDQIEEALDYYLVGLHHWNEALVYSVEKLLRYTDDKIVEEWKHIIGQNNEQTKENFTYWLSNLEI